MFLFQSRISYAKQNFREDSEPNHLEDSEMTPRSCLDEDSELKLLTSSYETTSMQLLPQSVRLLQSQLKAERLASAQFRLDVNDAKYVRPIQPCQVRAFSTMPSLLASGLFHNIPLVRPVGVMGHG